MSEANKKNWVIICLIGIMLIISIYFHLKFGTVILFNTPEIQQSNFLSETPTIIQRLNPSKTPLVSITPTKVQRIVFEKTPVSILKPNEEIRFLEALNDQNCKLPCVLGIIPGKTTVKAARERLNDLGGNSTELMAAQDFFFYQYYFEFGAKLPSNDFVFYENVVPIIFDYSVQLVFDKDIVQGVNIDGVAGNVKYMTPKGIGIIRKYVERFMISSIFKEVGQPDKIFITKPEIQAYGDQIALVYDKLGVIIQVYGTEKEINICPLYNPASSIGIRISTLSKTSEIETIKRNLLYRMELPGWLPINQLVDIGRVEFYDMVMANPTSCAKPHLP